MHQSNTRLILCWCAKTWAKSFRGIKKPKTNQTWFNLNFCSSGSSRSSWGSWRMKELCWRKWTPTNQRTLSNGISTTSWNLSLGWLQNTWKWVRFWNFFSLSAITMALHRAACQKWSWERGKNTPGLIVCRNNNAF